MELGLALAAFSAVVTALWDVHTKHICKSFESPLVGNIVRGLVVPPTVAVVLYLQEPQSWGLWVMALRPALLSSLMNVGSLYLQLRAFQLSPINSTVPYMSFQSVFAVAASWVVMGEQPGGTGVVGVMVVTFGGFWLNSLSSSTAPGSREDGEGKGKRADPERFVRLPTWLGGRNMERGSLCMLGAALMFSVQAALDKLGCKAASPLVYVLVNMTLLLYFNLSMFVVGVIRAADERTNGHATLRHVAQGFAQQFAQVDALQLGFNGLLWLTSYLSFILAMRLTLVAYCVAVKRAGCLLTVIVGWLAFNERGFARKLPAIVLMVMGVMVIVASDEMQAQVGMLTGGIGLGVGADPLSTLGTAAGDAVKGGVVEVAAGDVGSLLDSLESTLGGLEGKSLSAEDAARLAKLVALAGKG